MRPLLVERSHDPEDHPMGIEGEVLRLQHLADRDDRIAVEQDTAQDGLFRLEVARQDLIGGERGILRRHAEGASCNTTWMEPRTSVWSFTGTVNVPSVLSGSSNSISRRSMARLAVRASSSAMSLLVIDP